MPSVAEEELAALRAGGGVKARAANFENGASISTPEAMDAAYKAKREEEKRRKLSAKDHFSKWGSGAASHTVLEQSLEVSATKKAWQEKVDEANKRSTSTKTSNVGQEVKIAPAPQAQKEEKLSDDDFVPDAEQGKVDEPEENPLSASDSTTTDEVGQETNNFATSVAALQAPKEEEEPSDDVVAPDVSSDEVEAAAEEEEANETIESGNNADSTTTEADDDDELEMNTPSSAAAPAPEELEEEQEIPNDKSIPGDDDSVTEVEDPIENDDQDDVTEVEVVIENDEEEEDEDFPNLEEAGDIPENEGSVDGSVESRQVTNRNERKARKMMQRLGMSPVEGIERATFKTGGQGGYFFIDNPDVYKIDKSYIIFGEARQGGNMQQQQAAMAQAQAQAAMAQAQQQSGTMPSVAEEGVEIEEVPELAEAGVDESGVEEKDISLVMSQASCSRAKAIKALRENDNDLVNAIMSLTV